MKDDISEFCRKMRLTDEFYEKHIDDNSVTINESNYILTKEKNKPFILFCEHITNYPYQLRNKLKHRQNPTKREWNDIKELKEDKTIRIKEVDKDNVVVLMNAKDYKNLVLS